MGLTKKKAISISLELWTWLAETGGLKPYWPGWEKYGEMIAHCALCEYNFYRLSVKRIGGDCPYCPYFEKFGHCSKDTPYFEWSVAHLEKDRKRYAGEFLAQLKELR